MPIIYRPRAPSFSSDTETETETTGLTPTDADDSIVLSDLVRTGEASRLRRRGAMRLDHGLTGQPNPPRAPSPATIIVVGSPTWESESEDRDGTGPVFARNDRERGGRYGRAQQREIRRSGEDDGEDFRFTLFCGGDNSEPEFEVDDRSWTSYEPPLLPLYPSTSTAAAIPSSSAHARRRSKRSNGCGALLHMHAAPRKRLGVWTAKSEASNAVVGMDPMYFDRTAVAKIVRSACGCIREGVGCTICGNPLGTRYKPCKTAGDGIFSARSNPTGPLYPEGPRYWHAHTHSPSTRPSNPNFYVYTFFSVAVSSSPSYTFPLRPPPHTRYSEASQPLQPQILQPSSQPQAQIQPELRQPEETNGNTPTTSNLMFDRVLTSSPANLEEIVEEDQESYRGGYLAGNTPGYLQVPFRGPNTNAMQVEFDPDGEFIAADSETEPSSPDKTNDVMLFPER